MSIYRLKESKNYLISYFSFLNIDIIPKFRDFKYSISNISFGALYFFSPAKAISVIVIRSSTAFASVEDSVRKEKYEYISLERKQELFNSLKEYLEKFPSDTLYQAKFDKLIYFDKVLKAKTQEEFDEITSKYLKNEIGFSGYWNDAGQYVLKSDYSDLEKIVTSDDLEIHPKIEEVVFEDDLIGTSNFKPSISTSNTKARELVVSNSK